MSTFWFEKSEKEEEQFVYDETNVDGKRWRAFTEFLDHHGARHSHGECSFGYEFELEDGRKLIIGSSDEDVSDPHHFWIQIYKPQS